MNPVTQYCLVGALFLISAVVMALSACMGQTHSKLDILVIIFSAISFLISFDQFRRGVVTWYALRKKLVATGSNA